MYPVVALDRCCTAQPIQLIPADRSVAIGRKNDRFKKIEDVREAGAVSPHPAAFGPSRWRGRRHA
jgi:hypothetical protein